MELRDGREAAEKELTRQLAEADSQTADDRTEHNGEYISGNRLTATMPLNSK